MNALFPPPVQRRSAAMLAQLDLGCNFPANRYCPGKIDAVAEGALFRTGFIPDGLYSGRAGPEADRIEPDAQRRGPWGTAARARPALAGSQATIAHRIPPAGASWQEKNRPDPGLSKSVEPEKAAAFMPVYSPALHSSDRADRSASIPSGVASPRLRCRDPASPVTELPGRGCRFARRDFATT